MERAHRSAPFLFATPFTIRLGTYPGGDAAWVTLFLSAGDGAAPVRPASNAQ